MASPIINNKLPIPEDLPKLLHYPKTPWHNSPNLHERISKEHNAQKNPKPPFTKVQVTAQDPEYTFVLRYFQHQKPPHYNIKNIYCIHNSNLTKGFESSFAGMEAAAKSFPSAWNKEEPIAHRTKTIDRWKTAVAPFSPFNISSANRVDTFSLTKIVPLWHGTQYIDSICQMGFTFFGKHHFFDKSVKAGEKTSTDIGFFGSGIYFTNSAHYASMYHSGSLLLSWVSMREPYPVVNDVTIPKKGADMKKLQGQGAYSTYTAHYIPVTSVDPQNAENMIYHPCHDTEQPAWDEYVVFQPNHALPHLIIELGVDLPISPSNTNHNVSNLIDVVIRLLDNPQVQEDKILFQLLSDKSESLFSLDGQTSLSPENLAFYNRTVQILDQNGKIRSYIKNQITQPRTASVSPSSQTTLPPPSIAKVVKQNTAGADASNVGAGNVLNHKTGYVQKSVNAEAGYQIPTAPSPPKIPQRPAQNSFSGHLGQHPVKVNSGTSVVLPQKPLVADQGPYAIHKAVERGDTSMVKLLAANKQLLETKDLNGDTPLMISASKGNAALCNILIQAGASPYTVNAFKSGRNAFLMAVFEGRLEVVMNFSAYPQMLAYYDAEGDTPLMIAATQGHAHICKVLINAGANPKEQNDKKDYSNALLMAAMAGKHEVVELLAKFKDLVDAEDEKWRTPFYVGVHGKFPKVCKALLLAGVSPYGRNGRNILKGAIELEDVEILQLVLKMHKYLVNEQDKDKGTPLCTAAAKGNLKIFQLMIEAGADPQIPDPFSLMACAVSGKNIEIIKILAANKKILQSKGINGDTPLINCAITGDSEGCKALLSVGANKGARNNQRQNALECAILYKNEGVIKVLNEGCVIC